MNFENIHWQNTSYFKKLISIVLLFSLFCCLSACCVRNKVDPLEKFNRKIFVINSTVDSLYIKPAALFYDKFLPKPFRYATNNFFSNLREVPTIVNDLLQLKFKQARCALARLCINTTWGVGGLIDVATWLGKIEKHTNDFGLTMAHYGYRESIYLVIPLIGPSTFRDGIGIYVDTYTGVWPYIRPAALGWTLYAISLVDARAKMLYAEPIIEEASVDRYIFIRNAYLQHRRYLMDLDKDPEVCDLSASTDVPDDNEAVSTKDGNASNKPLASDMPDDNEDLKPGDKSAKDKDGKDKDKKEEDEKPKVGAAAVAALEVDDIYNPTAQGSQSLALFEAIKTEIRKQTFETILYIAPGAIFKLTIILPPLKHDAITNDRVFVFQEISSSTSIPSNPEEIKGTSTITDAVGGQSR
jgi:ABC-type transporter lipoprotein component MlaA